MLTKVSLRQRVPGPRGCKHEPKTKKTTFSFFLFLWKKKKRGFYISNCHRDSSFLKRTHQQLCGQRGKWIHSLPPPTRRGLLSVTDAPSPLSRFFDEEKKTDFLIENNKKQACRFLHLNHDEPLQLLHGFLVGGAFLLGREDERRLRCENGL